MSEAEFEELLERVRSSVTALAPDDRSDDGPQDDIASEDAAAPRRSPVGIIRTAFPRPANDNDIAWPLLPFPDGWHASS